MELFMCVKNKSSRYFYEAQGLIYRWYIQKMSVLTVTYQFVCLFKT